MLGDLTKAIAGGSEETAQQPAPDELLQTSLPPLGTVAEPLEDAV
jgi:hypothetical protein